LKGYCTGVCLVTANPKIKKKGIKKEGNGKILDTFNNESEIT